MKVLHVIPSLAKEKGGPTQISLDLIRALNDCGVEAEIATTNDNGSGLLNVPLFEKINYEGVPVWFLPRFAMPLKEFIFSPALTKWLWQNLGNYQLIHTHYLFSYAPTAAAAIARWHNLPYIVTPYGMLTNWALNHQRQKKRAYSLIERYNFHHAVAAHCATEDESKDVENFRVSTPTFVIPYGVGLPVTQDQARQKLRSKYQIKPATPIVLYFSRLHSKKRPDLLIKSLGKLTDQLDFHLLIAGSGEPDYENYLQNLTNSLGLTKRTTFTGFVTGQDKEILLQGSDLFVLPSFSENFGIAVAEAMAAKLPVIVTPGVQIASEIVAADAGIAIDGGVENLAKAISQLLQFPNLRTQLGERGFELVQRRYSWKVIATQMANIYTEIHHNQGITDHLYVA